MNSLLDSLKDCIDALKAKAKDAAEKAALMAEELAAWLRAQSQARAVGASPTDITRVDTLIAECQALPAPAVGAASAPVGKLDFDRIKKLIEFVLGLLK